MPIEALIIVVVGLFYVGDLFIAVSPHAVLFRATWGGRFRLATAGESGIRIRDNLLLAPLGLLPFTRVFVAELPPIGIGRDVITAWPLATLAPTPASWDVDWQISPAEQPALALDGKSVVWQGLGRARFSSQVAAEHARDLLLALRDATAEQRTVLIASALAESLDTDAINEAVELTGQWTASLRYLCTLLSLFVFALLPCWVIFELPIEPWRLGGVYLVLLAAIQFTAWRAHRALLPDRRGQRWSHAFAILVSPAEAMTAALGIGREVLGAFHPLAIARALCRDADHARFAERLARGLRHPSPASPLLADERRATLEALARWYGAEDLWRGEPTPEAGSVGYCPRCLQQLTRIDDDGDCPTCPGVAVVRFTQPASLSHQPRTSPAG